MVDDEWLKKYQRGSVWASFLFAIPLTAFLSYIGLFLPEPTDFQRQIARFVAALDAGLFAVFLVGGVSITWKPGWGLSVSAGAGFALVILMLFVPQINPFPPPNRPVGQPTFRGEKLGTLVEILEERYASGETSERVLVGPDQRDEISNFSLGAREWTGETWVQLVRRICHVHPCLQCDVSTDSKILELKLAGQVQKRCLDAACVEYRYACESGQ